MKNQTSRKITNSLNGSKYLNILSSGVFLANLAVMPAQAINFSPDRPNSVTLSEGSLTGVATPFYTTFGDPDDYIVSSPSPFSGVANLWIEGELFTDEGTISVGGYCTGALLSTGLHILTAAHCLEEPGFFEPNGGIARFYTAEGEISLDIPSFFVHPDWDGDFYRGNDIGIIQLASEVDEKIPRYEIYRDRDEVGRIGDKVGYGRSGTGEEGETLRSGIKRAGQNLYDALADVMLPSLDLIPGQDFVPGSMLQYDFDNGREENDAFGFFFDLVDLGLGQSEVMAAIGDSGSPTLIDGKIAGIASYGIVLIDNDDLTSDIDGFPPFNVNSSFGEFGNDTRVSFYASWIDSVVKSPQRRPLVGVSVPEPGTFVGLLGLGTGLLLKRLKDLS